MQTAVWKLKIVITFILYDFDFSLNFFVGYLTIVGTPDASSTGVTVKPADGLGQKSNPGLPKAPQNNVVTPSSGTTGPSTPVKGTEFVVFLSVKD